jgi:hypothetical protein
MLALQASGKSFSLLEIAKLVVRIRRSFSSKEDAHRAYEQAFLNFASATEALYGSA